MPHARTDTLRLGSRTSLFQRLRDAVTTAAARHRDRRLIARLDAHLLRDIGLTPEAARAEAAKPFWRP